MRPASELAAPAMAGARPGECGVGPVVGDEKGRRPAMRRATRRADGRLRGGRRGGPPPGRITVAVSSLRTLFACAFDGREGKGSAQATEGKG